MFKEKSQNLISTWETRFLPGMLQLKGRPGSDDIDLEDFEPSQGETDLTQGTNRNLATSALENYMDL